MLKLILITLAFQTLFALKTSKPCRAKEAEFGTICTCDENYCDTLDVPLPKTRDSYILITSSQSGERFSYMKHSKSSQSNASDSVDLTISQKVSHRKIIGFGGSFTGSVSFILQQFSPKLRAQFYNIYFSTKIGIGYNMMRIPIGGSDFDTELWVYALQPENDTQLNCFRNLDHRDKLRNKQIKELKAVSGNNDIKIVSAVWIAAPWLRQRNVWNGHKGNQILPQYYQTWADYHAKWLNLMRADGVPIWGLSPGNEPEFARDLPIASPSLSWNGTNQGKWLTQYLKPTLKRTGNDNLKILGVDDMRGAALGWLDEMTHGDTRSVKNIDIIALHAYFDNSTSSDILDDLHSLFDKPILYTEMSFGVLETKPILLGSWTRAESLISILMDILSHDVVGYIDWNLVLNSTGGPKYDDINQLDAFVIANENFTGFIKQPMYYAMAHFAKYILPGSRLIETNICKKHSPFIRTVAYLRPDNRVSVILYNNHTEKAIKLNIYDNSNGVMSFLLEPMSLKTLIYLRK